MKTSTLNNTIIEFSTKLNYSMACDTFMRNNVSDENERAHTKLLCVVELCHPTLLENYSSMIVKLGRQ